MAADQPDTQPGLLDINDIKRTVKSAAENPIESVARGIAFLGFDSSNGTSQETYRILRTFSVWGMGRLVNYFYYALGLNSEVAATIQSTDAFLKALYVVFAHLNDNKHFPLEHFLEGEERKQYLTYVGAKTLDDEPDKKAKLVRKAQAKKDALLKTLKRQIHALARKNGQEGLIVNLSKAAIKKQEGDEGFQKYQVAEDPAHAATLRNDPGHLEEARSRRFKKALIRWLAKFITLVVSTGEGFVAFYLALMLGWAFVPALMMIFIPAVIINLILFYPNAKDTFQQLFMWTRVCKAHGKDFHYVWNLFLHDGEEISFSKKVAVLGSLVLAAATGAVFGLLSYYACLSGLVFLPWAPLIAPLAVFIAVASALSWMALFYVAMADLIKHFEARWESVRELLLFKKGRRVEAAVTLGAFVVALPLTIFAMIVSGGLFQDMLLNKFFNVTLGLHGKAKVVWATVISSVAAFTSFIFNLDSISEFFRHLGAFIQSTAISVFQIVTRAPLIVVFGAYLVLHALVMVPVNVFEFGVKKLWGLFGIKQPVAKVEAEKKIARGEELGDASRTSTALLRAVAVFCTIYDAIGQAGAVNDEGVMALRAKLFPASVRGAVLNGALAAGFAARCFAPNVNESRELCEKKEEGPPGESVERKSFVTFKDKSMPEWAADEKTYAWPNKFSMTSYMGCFFSSPPKQDDTLSDRLVNGILVDLSRSRSATKG